MKRIENEDLPEVIFRVIKVDRSIPENLDDLNSQIPESISSGFFRVVKPGNFKH
jgi:hypothetical protein